MVKTSNNSKLIVTLGDKGALYNNKLYKTDKVEVYDVCGAGDVFLSALAVHFLLTNRLEDAIMFANRCASFSVSRKRLQRNSAVQRQN